MRAPNGERRKLTTICIIFTYYLISSPKLGTKIILKITEFAEKVSNFYKDSGRYILIDKWMDAF